MTELSLLDPDSPEFEAELAAASDDELDGRIDLEREELDDLKERIRRATETLHLFPLADALLGTLRSLEAAERERARRSEKARRTKTVVITPYYSVEGVKTDDKAWLDHERGGWMVEIGRAPGSTPDSWLYGPATEDDAREVLQSWYPACTLRRAYL
jgi:hypothetical protein